MSQDETILIAGDSWACGEWEKASMTYTHGGLTNSLLIHGGLTDYLIDQGHRVINLGYPGGSNHDSTNRLSNFLIQNKKIIIKNIIVFQTEWLRSNSVPLDIKEGYFKLQNTLISRFYCELSELSTKFNIPIYIIGGTSDTVWIDQFEKEYPGVKVVCQSFSNLLLTNNHKISNPVYSLMTADQSKQIEYFKNNSNQADLQLMLDDMDRGQVRFILWKNHKEFFWPDGTHPNRYAHKILFEFLKTQIPDL
jgi:lysophospholipase L1-like esterase